MATLAQWIECDGLPRRVCNKFRQRHGYEPLQIPAASAVNVVSSRPDHKKKPAKSRPALVPDVVPNFGPGTELKRILEENGVTEKAGCGCMSVVRRMNQWGPDGCEAHMDEITAHLRKAAAKQSIHEKRRLAWNLLKSQGWLNPLDPYKSLVEIAIDAARVAAASSEENQTKEIA